MKRFFTLFIGAIIIFLIIAFVASRPQKSAQAASSWKFVVYGDNRTNLCDHISVLNGIQLKVPDRLTVLDVGDLTTNGTVTEMRSTAANCGGKTYYGWEGMVSGVLGTDWSSKSYPPDFVTAIGNHEYNSSELSIWMGDLKQNNLSAYPDVPVNSGGTYGSFKLNNTLFIWLDPSSNITNQNAFLTSTFQKANADSSVKWRFVFFHYPENSCGGGHPGINPQSQAWHDNYFVPNKVDMVFSGHNHYYERSCALLTAAGTCDQKGSSILNNPKAPVEIITGGGGAPLHSVSTSCSWLEKGQSTLEFVELQVGDTELQLKAWNPSNLSAPIDTLTIDKISSPPTLTKSVDKTSAISGDILNYTLNYSSPSGNQNASITDVVPIGSSFNSVSDGGVLSGNTITWTLGNLVAGAAGAVHFSVKVP